MSTFAERKQAATPAEATVHLCLDLRLHDRRREAYAELQRLQAAERRGSDEEQTTLDAPRVGDRLAAQLQVVDDIDAELDAKSEPYVLRKMQRHEWRELGEKHPATDEEREAGGDIHVDTFWPEAIAACAHDPQLTEDDVLWLRDGDSEWTGLPPAEFNRFVNALQDLHSTGVQVPKELLSIATTLRRGRSGTTPAAGESRSRSSAGGSRKRASRTG